MEFLEDIIYVEEMILEARNLNLILGERLMRKLSDLEIIIKEKNDKLPETFRTVNQLAKDIKEFILTLSTDDLDKFNSQ